MTNSIEIKVGKEVELMNQEKDHNTQAKKLEE